MALPDAPPIYPSLYPSYEAEQPKYIATKRVIQQSVGGFKWSTWFLIFVIVEILLDAPLIIKLFTDSFTIQTVDTVIIIIIDIFLLLTALSRGLTALKYIEVFSHLALIFNIFLFFVFGIVFGFFRGFGKELMGMLPEEARKASDSMLTGNSASIFFKDSSSDYLWTLLYIELVFVFRAVFAGMRRYLAKKVIADEIIMKKEINEMKLLTTHV